MSDVQLNVFDTTEDFRSAGVFEAISPVKKT